MGDDGMSRRMLIDISVLTEAQRRAILEAAQARGFEAVFANGGPLGNAEIYFGANGTILEAAPSLRWMCVPSAGANQYLKPVADRRDVVLSNSSGAYGVTIAEHVVMVTLEMMRRQADYNEIVARREWVRNLPVRSIRGSRVTLLGTGDIGREVAQRFRAFGPKRLVGVNRRGCAPEGIFDEVCTLADLDAVLPETDVLVMSLPGTDQTRHLLNAQRLNLLPQDAFIVNVGRGTTLDEAALIEMLKAGRFAGAALDVFEQEPLPGDSPAWDCPRLLLTPHVAGNMTLPYTVERIVQLFLEDFGRYCDGQPLLRRVDVGQGY